jgi:hypothetical protein
MAAALLVLAVPTESLTGWFGSGAALAEELALGVGMLPLLSYLGWLGWKHRRRDEHAYGPRIAILDARLEALEEDLASTDSRLHHARRELDRAKTTAAVRELAEEVRQDERLRDAQRHLVAELRRRVETLRIERWLLDLAYFEAARDARRVEPVLVLQLEERIVQQQRDVHLRNAPRELWEPALEEARALCRSLSRGVPRLIAAARLEPLDHSDLAGRAPRIQRRVLGYDANLVRATEAELERIDTSFEALSEVEGALDEALAQDDDSGVRYRVEDGRYEEESLELEPLRRARRGGSAS